MLLMIRLIYRYNRYAVITSKAVRRALKEEKRVEAERRGTQSVRVIKWDKGQQGEQKQLYDAEK